eukprot:Gb_11605 [translate_table: standard]
MEEGQLRGKGITAHGRESAKGRHVPAPRRDKNSTPRGEVPHRGKGDAKPKDACPSPVNLRPRTAPTMEARFENEFEVKEPVINTSRIDSDYDWYECSGEVTPGARHQANLMGGASVFQVYVFEEGKRSCKICVSAKEMTRSLEADISNVDSSVRTMWEELQQVKDATQNVSTAMIHVLHELSHIRSRLPFDPSHRPPKDKASSKQSAPEQLNRDGLEFSAPPYQVSMKILHQQHEEACRVLNYFFLLFLLIIVTKGIKKGGDYMRKGEALLSQKRSPMAPEQDRLRKTGMNSSIDSRTFDLGDKSPVDYVSGVTFPFPQGKSVSRPKAYRIRTLVVSCMLWCDAFFPHDLSVSTIFSAFLSFSCFPFFKSVIDL